MRQHVINVEMPFVIKIPEDFPCSKEYIQITYLRRIFTISAKINGKDIFWEIDTRDVVLVWNEEYGKWLVHPNVENPGYHRLPNLPYAENRVAQVRPAYGHAM